MALEHGQRHVQLQCARAVVGDQQLQFVAATRRAAAASATRFASAGTRVLPMSDLDHYRDYKRFLNPSLNDRFEYDAADGFSPELSLQENCWHSEGNGQSDFGFFLDGHYHSLIVLTRWPRTTWAVPPSRPRWSAPVWRRPR